MNQVSVKTENLFEESERSMFVQLNVKLLLPPNFDGELIKNLSVHHDHMTDSISFKEIHDELVKRGFELKFNIFSYFSMREGMYVYLDSVKQMCYSNKGIPISDLRVVEFSASETIPPIYELTLKCRAIAQVPGFQNYGEYGQEQMQMNAESGMMMPIPEKREDKRKRGRKDRNIEPPQNPNAKFLSHRTKERKIGFIIEKVSMWRKLYNGVPDDNGNSVRYSLEEAAQKVCISKKSLDDYLLQLRFGRKFGFNFNEHKDDKVGVLRAYVKKHKLQNKQLEKGNDQME